MIKAEHVVPHVYQEASGTKYAVLRLCRSLGSCGVDPRLHVLEPASVAGYDVTFDVKTYPVSQWSGQRSVSPAMARGLREAAQTADILHNHGLWMMPNVYPGKSIKNTHCQLICSPHGTLSEWAWNRSYWKKQLFWHVWQRSMLKSCRCFHATAEQEARDIWRRGLTQPVALIPNGVDVPEIDTSRQRNGQRKRLLFVGRVHPTKGVDYLIRAWARLHKQFPDWELAIVGPDFQGSLQEMQHLVDQLQAERVSLVGPLYGKEKEQAYLDADLYVLPTHTENFGLTIAEALAHRLPVITTKGAPWQGLLEHQSGWWIEVGEEPLFRCLEEVLRISAIELEEYGQRGRAWMQRDFSWPAIGKKMSQTYEWMLGGGPSPEWVRSS